ncbi:MAG: 3-dehydroquinate synthase [Anaerofustis stercorihominis]|nr:3-dehydroquinate synthase [Anaerofustis stercorihominis]
MILTVKTSQSTYDIIFEKGGLSRIDKYWGKGDKTFIVTDSGVPEIYAQTVASHCKDPFIYTIPQGEASKQVGYLIKLWEAMTEFSLTRTDRVIAVGGGVVGDIAGFAAATYMRGIDFYVVPTTVLSQVDSSVGGKTAIDLKGYKNTVGAFYQPKGVLIDANTLTTLPKRQIANGLAEAIKMAATHDSELFEMFEKADLDDICAVEELLIRSVDIKRGVVERDEKETGERKALNFGHTLAHALESKLSFDEMYHGECVALGMLPMCSDEVRERLIALLKRAGLKTQFPVSPTELIELCRHDKKCSGEYITIVYVPQIGSFELRKITFDEFADYITKAVI